MLSAAAFSPTANSKIAARSTPRPTRSLSAFARLPILHDLRDALRVLGREVLRYVDVLLIVVRPRQLRILSTAHETLLLHGLRLDLAHHHARRRRLFDEILEERFEDREDQHQHRDARELLLAHVPQPWRLQQRRFGRRLQLGLFGERGIDDIEAVAALRIEADRLFGQGGEACDLFLAARLARDVAVGVGLLMIVDHHGNGEALHVAGGELRVADGLVEFVVARHTLHAVLRRRGFILIVARIGSRRAGDGRLGGQRAWYARSIGAVRLILEGLLAADRGEVGVVTFLRLLDHAEIHVGRDLRTHAVAPEHGYQDVFDALDVIVFELIAIFELRGGEPDVARRLRAAQKTSCLIHHRHLVGREIGDAGGDEVDDGRDLAGIELRPGVQGQHHRGRGRLAVADERRLLGYSEVHARALYGADAADGLREFTLERALIARVLHELAHTETLFLVQQLEARGAALRQPLACDAQTRLVHLVGGHEDGAAASRHLVRNGGLIEGLGDLEAVLITESGVV